MAQSALKTCEICMQADGRDLCAECEQVFCENCKIMHLKMKISRNHTFQKPCENKEVEMCPNHKSQYIFFCEKCDAFACKTCVVTTHKGHKMKEFNDGIKKKQREFSKEIHSYSEVIEKMKRVGIGLEKRRNSQDIIKKMEEDRDRIILSIKDVFDKKIARIKKEYDVKGSVIESCIKKLNEVETTSVNVKEKVARLKEKNGIESLASLQDLLNEMTRDFYLPVLPEMCVTYQSADEDVKNFLGHLEEVEYPFKWMAKYRCPKCHCTEEYNQDDIEGNLVLYCESECSLSGKDAEMQHIGDFYTKP